MTEALLTLRCTEGPSTLLSMDTNVRNNKEASVTQFRQTALTGYPPDINLPLSSADFGSSLPWLPSSESFDMPAASFGVQSLEARPCPPSKGKRTVRRSDSIWGAWFFFHHYFKPSHANELGIKLDQFMVQHDMENMYMWVFRKRPQNALGKMQLRSYMNGHAQFGEPQFPYSADKGFNRSHRMQRKQYRGLSNPQCIHGITVVRSPDFACVSEKDQKRWVELTGTDLNFTLPLEASDFSSWRMLPSMALNFDGSSGVKGGSAKQQQTSIGGYDGPTLNLSCKLTEQMDPSGFNNPLCKKKRNCELASGNEGGCSALNNSPSGEILGEEIVQSERPRWYMGSSGVIVQGRGPVTGAKSIYEDEHGYLVMVSLPFTDMKKLRVSWCNTATHGVVKIHCCSTARVPTVMRGDRTFKLTDESPEHCPAGEFVREIPLATMIPEDAELKAFYVEESAGLEIMVPKSTFFSKEREVRVFLPPQFVRN